MSVASKTKTKMFTTVVLSFVAASIALPTWASTTQGTTPFTTVNPVVSTQSNQANADLGELRGRLKDRFSGVYTEVRSLIDGTTSPIDSFHKSAVRTIDVSQGIGGTPLVSSQNHFVDIENDPYKTYINRLAAYGVLSSSQKFLPQNYFRVDDFMTLFTKLYKKDIPQNIPGISSPDGLLTKGMLQQIMYALPDVEKVTIDGNPYDKLIRSEGAYYLVRMFDVPVLDTLGSSVSIEDGFTDIDDSPFADDIHTLASLNIINAHTIKFYPDNYLRHYDFAILFVNALLISKQQSLALISTDSSFADVDSSASYLPQLIYAADRGLIDSLIMSRGGQLYFGPNDFITKDEVYHILTKTTHVQFVYDEQVVNQEKISRAELAHLLVDSFQLQAKQPSPASSLSGAELNASDMSVLMKLKTLLSML